MSTNRLTFSYHYMELNRNNTEKRRHLIQAAQINCTSSIGYMEVTFDWWKFKSTYLCIRKFEIINEFLKVINCSTLSFIKELPNKYSDIYTVGSHSSRIVASEINTIEDDNMRWGVEPSDCNLNGNLLLSANPRVCFQDRSDRKRTELSGFNKECWQKQEENEKCVILCRVESSWEAPSAGTYFRVWVRLKLCSREAYSNIFFSLIVMKLYWVCLCCQILVGFQ